MIGEYAVIEGGAVANVIVADSEWTAPDGVTAILIPSGDQVGIGYAYDGSAFSAPVIQVSLADAKSAQCAAIDAAYAGAVQQSVTFKTAAGVTQTFQADTESQSILSQAEQGYAIVGAVPANFYWKAQDNTFVAFTLSDLQGLYVTMLSQGWDAFQKRATLKAEISAATTVSAVQSVAWS
jgi:hypothetical protein